MENELRPFWNKHFAFNWKFGLSLLLIVCIPRFILVLQANEIGEYGSIGAIMVISALCPLIFLTQFGRIKMGLTKPNRFMGLLLALLVGFTFSLLLYKIGISLYGNTYENWYTYIGKSYKIPTDINQSDKVSLFIIVALTGMLFSPIGEELFFRGIVHASVANSIGDKKASLVDSLAFAITHLSHFGLVYISRQWSFLPIPALLWVTAMFFVSMLFFRLKMYSGSILGAVFCHSAFNAGMTFCIFYLV